MAYGRERVTVLDSYWPGVGIIIISGTHIITWWPRG